jgi:hypothetical protein
VLGINAHQAQDFTGLSCQDVQRLIDGLDYLDEFRKIAVESECYNENDLHLI